MPKNKLTEKEIMVIVQGALRILVQDKNYYYHSNVGSHYCYLTDDGRKIIMDVIDMVAPKLHEAIREEDIQRSKELIINELKGN